MINTVLVLLALFLLGLYVRSTKRAILAEINKAGIQIGYMAECAVNNAQKVVRAEAEKYQTATQ
jgi:hypothetical protein